MHSTLPCRRWMTRWLYVVLDWIGVSQTISTQLKNYEDVSSILWDTRDSVRVEFLAIHSRLGPVPLTASHVERPRRPHVDPEGCAVVQMCSCCTFFCGYVPVTEVVLCRIYLLSLFFSPLCFYFLKFIFFLYSFTVLIPLAFLHSSLSKFPLRQNPLYYNFFCLI